MDHLFLQEHFLALRDALNLHKVIAALNSPILIRYAVQSLLSLDGMHFWFPTFSTMITNGE